MWHSEATRLYGTRTTIQTADNPRASDLCWKHVWFQLFMAGWCFRTTQGEIVSEPFWATNDGLLDIFWRGCLLWVSQLVFWAQSIIGFYLQLTVEIRETHTDDDETVLTQAIPQKIFEPRNTTYSLQMICPTDPPQKNQKNQKKIQGKGHSRAHTLVEFKEKFPDQFFTIRK